MPHTSKNFSHLLGLPGLSDTLLTNHFALYEGYVNNINKLAELSERLEIGTPQYAELKRRFGWEWNGMRLHELYFSNLTKAAAPLDTAGVLRRLIEERFGSYDRWEQDFRATGAIRGIGWVILAYDAEENRLFNLWIEEHNGGHLAGSTPLLVMDVFEHAYMTDYGIKRADYIECFFQSIDWETVTARLGSKPS